ncbi:MAG: magnesium/cobalt transporter CorA [Actinomycetota bacterium]|nr:magnesium/cobalt transporter CorA [Actinomycetota bacterium]
MLTIRHVHDNRATIVEPDRLGAALAGPGFVWLDLTEPTADEETVLDLPMLGIDPLAKEDIVEDVHLPKLDVYSDHALLTVHAIEIETSTVELTTMELDIVIARDYLLTYHRRRITAIDAIAQLVHRDQPWPDSPVGVAHRILNVMNDVFVPFLDLLGKRLDLVEEDVLRSPALTTRDEIFALRRDLITLRRISVPQADVIRRLGREQIPVVRAADRVYFRDVYDHLYRMAELSEVYRQLIESAYDMYRSVREDETNRRLAILTMVSTLLLPITAIAGIYGMNFVHMPELDETWVYPTLWVIFVILIAGGLLVFRSWGWLGREKEDAEAAHRQRLVERLELPILGKVVRVPAYGARFALKGGRRVAGMGWRLGRRRLRFRRRSRRSHR